MTRPLFDINNDNNNKKRYPLFLGDELGLMDNTHVTYPEIARLRDKMLTDNWKWDEISLAKDAKDIQDPSLKDMCFHYPTSLDDLTNIQGVGSGKATRYGEPFIALIAKYVDENDIERPQDMVIKSLVNKSGLKVQLIQNIDRKLPLEDIGRSQGKTLVEVIDEIEAIVSSGTRVNIKYHIDNILDSENQEEIYEYFSEAETDADYDRLLSVADGLRQAHEGSNYAVLRGMSWLIVG